MDNPPKRLDGAKRVPSGDPAYPRSRGNRLDRAALMLLARGRTLRRLLATGLLLLLTAGQARSQSAVKAVTNATTYNAGSQVLLKIVFPASGEAADRSAEILGRVRYAEGIGTMGVPKPLSTSVVYSSALKAPAYQALWRIPTDTRTGRYQVDLVGRDAKSHRVLWVQQDAASFAVHRKLVRIDEVRLDKTFYTPGDAVGCEISLRNLTDQPLTGLRVEFSDRYWPWIAGPAEAAKASIVALAANLSIPAGGQQTVASDRAAVAAEVERPSIHQYGVVVWDDDRTKVLDIAFSRLVFVSPPGIDSPKPYPGQYLYPDLSAVSVASYRHFYPPVLDSVAIQFDRAHTMFASGSAAEVSFSLRNPTSEAWRGVSVRARLLAPDGSEVTSRSVAQSSEIKPGDQPVKQSVTFELPSQPAGVYQVAVDAAESSGRTLASASLELGVNSLPKSIMIFCAHEDDEGGYDGMIRAAVENQIPIHFVYFTSGDAGSCDRYYERSCGPAEALNFGAIRMDEARAVLGHLGVPRDDVYFLGLPDGGSGEIWYNHILEANPYLAALLASDHAPYEGLFRPNLAYARDSVVETAEELIRRFQPQVIITAHPQSQGHIDHIVNSYFVVKALQALLREGAVSRNVKVLVDRVYDPKTLPPTPYHYEERDFYVSGEAMALAQEAGWFYQSQGGNRGEGELRDFKDLPRTEPYREMLDWSEHEGWNEKIHPSDR